MQTLTSLATLTVNKQKLQRALKNAEQPERPKIIEALNKVQASIDEWGTKAGVQYRIV